MSDVSVPTSEGSVPARPLTPRSSSLGSPLVQLSPNHGGVQQCVSPIHPSFLRQRAPSVAA